MGTLAYSDVNGAGDLFARLVSEEFSNPEDLKNRRSIATDPDPVHLLFLGRRKVRVAIYGVYEDAPEPPVETENPFTITFASDYVPMNDPPYPLSAAMIEKETGISGIEKKRVFCRPGLAYGWDITTKALPLAHTIGAGSCACLTIDEGKSAALMKVLHEKSLTGIGNGTLNGLGRFKINWPIHEI